MIKKTIFCLVFAVLLAGCDRIQVKRDYYPNGKLMVEKFTRGDKAVQKVYHINGNLIGEYEYRNGERHGASKIYFNDTGELHKIVTYKDGEEIGSKTVASVDGRMH